MPPTRDELRAFLDRPWAELRAQKDRYVAELVETEGAGEAFRLAEMLRAHAAAMGAARAPRDEDEDLAAAVRLKRLIDRAGRRPRRAR